MIDKKIRMYGTVWCPDCTRTKKFLSKHNIPFEWHDIEQNKEACAYVQEVNRGCRSVPTMLFPDGSILVEPSDAELEKKLESIGLACP